MLVKCAADELGEHNIRVNAVQPGIVDTELMSFITAGGPMLDSYYDEHAGRRGSGPSTTSRPRCAISPGPSRRGSPAR